MQRRLRGALARQPRRTGYTARAVGKAWPLAGGLGSVLPVPAQNAVYSSYRYRPRCGAI